MRLWKTVLGILLVGFALYTLVGEQIAGASADAVVNARLTTVRAPIAGRAKLQLKTLGARIRKGDPLGSLADSLVDTSNLFDLRNEQTKAETEAQRLRVTLAAIDSSIARLQARSEAYQSGRIRESEAQLTAARATAHASRSELELYKKMLDRSTRLSAQGIEARANFEQAQARVEVARRALESAQAQTAVREVTLDAARRGTFIGDGNNDVPYSDQRLGDLLLRKQEIMAELDAQTRSASALEARIGAERRLINRLSSASLTSNVDGIYWTVEIADGEVVQRGQDLLRLVDCSSTIVTLSVSESVYNSLAAGAVARFRMTGSSKVFEGTVIRLAGAGAADIYRNLAIAPSARHLERYDVALLVPALAADDELGCQVGRTGRVFFDGGPLSWLQRLWG